MTLHISNMRDLLPILISALLIAQPIASVRNETRCGSVDIRNNPKMAFQPKQYTKSWLRYKDCTILEGDFTISMITQSNVTDEMFPVFENLREITGSILVFQIRGLLSLGRMFPNLRVIGGHSLIMNYALVIYQNYDLRQVGLTKLTAIKNGGVRITENPQLCYTRNINWDLIMVGKIRDLIIDQAAPHCSVDCDVKDETHCYREKKSNKFACWNSTNCQKICPGVNVHNNRNSSGCTDAGEPCHEMCVGGCFRPNDAGSCYSCRHFDNNGTCVRECPIGLYAQLNRRCLTMAECHSLYPVSANPGRNEKSMWKAFDGSCHYECPRDFQEDPTNPHNCVPCEGYCPKKCPGDTVDSIGSAMKFSKCNMVEGNLELDMRIGMESTSGEKFTEAFGDIEEITGYLLIRFSTAFMSLHMFKRLRVIHGQQLWKNMYALVVFENPNLHQLFHQSKIDILRGKVSFQNNRMLCYKKIEAFVERVGLKENVSENDISPFSNGDKAICDEIPLEIKIVSVYSYGFVVSWTPFNTSDMDHRKFLGYQIFYKKVDAVDPNLSINDDRSACSDSWNMQFVTDGGDVDSHGDLINEEVNSNTPKGELINQGVEANTLYAVYVQTRLVNHPGARNAISRIHFVKTLFGVPDPPRIISGGSIPIDSGSIKIQWEPPLNPYGDITHYTVIWTLVTDTHALAFQNPCNFRHHSTSVTISSKKNANDTCPRDEGCCKCVGGDSAATVSSSGKLLDGGGATGKTGSASLISLSSDASAGSAEQTTSSSADDDGGGGHTLKSAGRESLDFVSEDTRSLEARHEEKANFENTIQNSIFVQKEPRSKNDSTKKLRRSLRSLLFTAKALDDEPLLNGDDESTTKSGGGGETKPSKVVYQPLYANEEYRHVPKINVTDATNNNSFTYGKVNITGTHMILTGLPHFTEYHVTVYACQDENAIDHYCSSRPGWVSVQTLPISGYDEVDPSTVVMVNVTDGKPNDKRIFWLPPRNPNGFVVSYRAKLFRDDESTPLEQCIPVKQFEHDNGVLFAGLSDGRYSLEIRVETTALLLNNATVIENIFELYTPGFFTTRVIVIIAMVSLLIIAVAGITLHYFITNMFGKKVEEYWRQTISANPEYLSQLDIYKADEWELRREDLVLEHEIGRGTFGMVLKGYGKNIKSITGEEFGECAVKTVPETANNAERLHFLIEASVMKHFNTQFIVKLYGVVSDGQPVLVVMELMEKGNLRDFLRSHRPNAEENKDNRPVPTLMQYFAWAAQIADGMAYLESLKFCHRDLAARNCMVHADESVKIGDFGMARDIYYHEYYKPAGKRMMPVRWMAPESLKDGKFTMKSDVWSYGIVLHEMLTLGEQPYAGLGNDQVFSYIVVQRRIARRPMQCPAFWYSLMRSCWQYDARDRPSFHQIVRHLKDCTDENFQRVSFVLNELQPSANETPYEFRIDMGGAADESDQNNIYKEQFVYGDDDEEEDQDDEDEEDVDAEEDECSQPTDDEETHRHDVTDGGALLTGVEKRNERRRRKRSNLLDDEGDLVDEDAHSFGYDDDDKSYGGVPLSDYSPTVAAMAVAGRKATPTAKYAHSPPQQHCSNFGTPICQNNRRVAGSNGGNNTNKQRQPKNNNSNLGDSTASIVGGGGGAGSSCSNLSTASASRRKPQQPKRQNTGNSCSNKKAAISCSSLNDLTAEHSRFQERRRLNADDERVGDDAAGNSGGVAENAF